MSKLEFNDAFYETQSVLSKLSKFITEERLEKLDRVTKERSEFFVPVLENLYDKGNISAVMRSSEAFGFYKMHIIQNSDEFKESKRVTQGAEKWLEVNQWKESKDCIINLKQNDYKVYTTSLSDDAISITDLNFEQKTAVILGNERDGVSEEAKALSDGNVLIPMQGFTQSFNISVAAALCFLTAKQKKPVCIDSNEQERLKALYILKTLNWPDKALNEALGL